MPGALYLAGRKLPFGSDDLFLPGVVGLITRSCMVVGLAICLGYAVSSTNSDLILNEICPTRGPRPVEIAFLAACLAFMCLHDVMYYFMVRISVMDTILQWQRRHKRAEVLINGLAVSYVAEVGLIVFGIVVLASNPCSPPNIVWIVLLTGLCLLITDIVFAIGFAYLLYRYFSPGERREPTWYRKRLHGIGWGFNVLTCGFFGNLDSPDGYGDDAWIQFGDIFHRFLHDMMKDLVVTDVVAAVLLLRVEQKRMQEETIKELAARAMSDPANSPFMLGDNKAYALSSGGLDDYENPNGKVQTYLWSTEKAKKIKLKAQLLNSSTPVSPRGSWISNLIASDGRVADPARRMEAFQALEMFDDYSPYQEAIYGWKLFIYSTPLKFLASLQWLNLSWFMPKFRSTGHSKRPDSGRMSQKRPNLRSQIEGRVFTHVTGLGDHHVIYASFTAYLGESVPYTICVDHDREAVVVAVRGTLSFADLVTDLMITPTELEFAGRQWGFDGNGKYVHGGMFQVANRIRYDIEKQQILDKLFNLQGAENALSSGPVAVVDMYDSEAFVTNDQLKKTDVAHYKLMIIGHSLGGGVASILSLLLRPKFPKVKCLAYEPPGCIFDRDLAEASKEWISSIVCGVDVVPRLSWQTAKRFRGQLFEMLRRSKTSKTKIMSTLFRNVPAEELLYGHHEVPEDEEHSHLARMIQKLSFEDDNPMDKIPMFLPGKILHLAKQSTEVGGCWQRKDRKYTPMWIEDRADFNDIQVTQWLLWDHFPNNDGRMIKKTLREALEAEGRISFGGAALMDAINPKLEV